MSSHGTRRNWARARRYGRARVSPTTKGLFTVLVADEQGLSPIAHFAERIARQRHDQEQLPTDFEQRILEDALLGQLARQIHTRTIEARDLVDAMDTQLRAGRMSSGLTIGVGWRLSDDLDTAHDGLVADWLTQAAGARIPLRVTLHQIRTAPLSIEDDEIFVCQNPAVLRAAAALPAAGR